MSAEILTFLFNLIQFVQMFVVYFFLRFIIGIVILCFSLCIKYGSKNDNSETAVQGNLSFISKQGIKSKILFLGHFKKSGKHCGCTTILIFIFKYGCLIGF